MGYISVASAQRDIPMSTSTPERSAEVIKLSSRADGDYQVERFLLQESSNENNEFETHYKVNLSKLLSEYDDNSDEIQGLQKFIKSIQNDSLKSITECTIVGYASPDGPVAYNQRLSKARATDCASYLDSNCPLKNCDYTTEWIASDWNDARDAISRSSIPNKTRVIAIIDSGASQAEISSKLKAIPTSWRYLCSEILPPMRCAEVRLKYNSWRVVEERDYRPRSSARTKTVIFDKSPRSGKGYYNYATGILIAMPEDLDYDDCKIKGEKRKRYKEKDKYKSNRNRTKYKERDGQYREEERIRSYYR